MEKERRLWDEEKQRDLAKIRAESTQIKRQDSQLSDESRKRRESYVLLIHILNLWKMLTLSLGTFTTGECPKAILCRHRKTSNVDSAVGGTSQVSSSSARHDN